MHSVNTKHKRETGKETIWRETVSETEKDSERERNKQTMNKRVTQQWDDVEM